MVDVFTSQNARKRYKEHIQRQANNKEGTVGVFRAYSAYAHVVLWFVQAVNKQTRYSVCIQLLKALK